MSYNDIDYRVEDGVALVTLDRPDKMNAWGGDMDAEVWDAMQQAAADDAVRVIVLTGAGRGFCAGADMQNLVGIQAGGSAGGARLGSEKLDRRIDKGMPEIFGDRNCYFPAVPKPVIGAINGAAAGLGMVFALYCDIRIMSTAAKMSTVFAKRGLVAEYGLSWLLQRLVGPARAADLLFSGRFVHAEEAERIGLVNMVAPAETFMDDVMAYASDLAHNVSPRSMRVMKHQLWVDALGDLGGSVELAKQEMVKSFDSEDFKEGVAHFLEKREPRFTGR